MWTGTGNHDNDDSCDGDDNDHEDKVDVDDTGKNVGVDNDDSYIMRAMTIIPMCSHRVNEKIEEEYRKEREAKTSPSKSKKPARH